MKLISAAECVRKLRKSGVFSGNASYFSQLVSKGVIPHHKKGDSPKKWYIYEEAKKAIQGWKDPTRDAQREANRRKRNGEDACDDIQKLKEEAEAAKKEAIAAGASENEDIWKSSIPAGITQAEAKAEKEYWLGRKAELEFKKMSGELISVEEVQREAFEMAKGVRDTFLALPARLAPILAADSDQFSIQNKLMIEINSALESLSDE